MYSHHFKVCHNEKLGSLDYDEERFEKFFGIKYLRQLEFENWEVEQFVKKSCTRVIKKNRIGQNAKWLGTLYSSMIEKAYIPNITIKWIHEQVGYGVFTNDAISPWQYMGEYTGVLRKRRMLFPDINDYCFMYPKTGLFLNPLTVDSQQKGNFTRYINHSDKPNLESITVFAHGIYHIIFRSIKHIPAGVELSYDYGDFYWANRYNKLSKEQDCYILS